METTIFETLFKILSLRASCGCLATTAVSMYGALLDRQGSPSGHDGYEMNWKNTEVRVKVRTCVCVERLEEGQCRGGVG